jgi:hypothetical protein
MKKVFLLLAALAGLASCHKTGNEQAEKVSPQDSTVLYVALMPTVLFIMQSNKVSSTV